MVEMGASGFSLIGFLAFTFSAFLESVRVVYIQLLLSSRLKYNAVEVGTPCLVWIAFEDMTKLKMAAT